MWDSESSVFCSCNLRACVGLGPCPDQCRNACERLMIILQARAGPTLTEDETLRTQHQKHVYIFEFLEAPG